MNKKHLLPVLTAALLTVPFAAQAAERPLFGAAPDGFKKGYQAGDDRQTIAEFVPQKQTVHNWTQMVTHQTFKGSRQGAAGFRSTLSSFWMNSCPKSAIAHLTEGEENGYPFALWRMTCYDNPQTGKPEYTFVKAVQGNEGLYVKQYAFRYIPNKQEMALALGHLRDFFVCDNTVRHTCAVSVNKLK